MKLTDIFEFGKYKGLTLKEVCAEHGSYVGWCIENIPDFHIEPKNVEDAFLRGHERWKQNHTGLTMTYKPSSCPLPLGFEGTIGDIKSRLDETILGEY